MKQYVIDQLRPADFESVKAYLDKNCNPSHVDGIYWVSLDQDILTDVQMEHSECHPFYFAVELEQNSMACEFLIRTQKTIRCSCMGYATEKQRNRIIRFADSVFDELDIKI